MITRQQVLDSFLGKNIVDSLIETLYNQDDDFPEIHKVFLESVKALKQKLGPDAESSIARYIVAIEQMCSSNLYYAGMQGLKMNFDHFLNPMCPNCTWSQVDYDDFINLDTAYSLPMYESAYKFAKSFEKLFGEGLSEFRDAIISYETALETAGMKLAHYYGYLMGNDLLYHFIPGYHPDRVLDMKYTYMLEQYFGAKLSKDQWDGCINLNEWKIAQIPEVDPQDVFTMREQIWKASAE